MADAPAHTLRDNLTVGRKPKTFSELLAGTMSRGTKERVCDAACGRLATHTISLTVAKPTGDAASKGRTPSRKVTSNLSHCCEECAVEIYTRMRKIME
jgi:hypothetical protein